MRKEQEREFLSLLCGKGICYKRGEIGEERNYARVITM